MKRRYAVFAVIFAVSVLIGIHSQPNTTTVRGYSNAEGISFLSPENKTYTVNNLTLTFTADTGGAPAYTFIGGLGYVIYYYLDCNMSIIEAEGFPETSMPLSLPASYSGGNITFALTNLSEGSHHVTVLIAVFLMGNCISYHSSTVYFTVDSIPPELVIFSPQFLHYNQSFVPLNLSVSETTSEMQYSLDGQANVTVTGNFIENTTLTDLSNGIHNVTIYATDFAGNTSNQTVNFTVAKPAEPFPTLTVAVSGVIAVIAVIIASSLLYRRHQKNSRLSE
jgi:hypothetical protein